MELKIVRQVKMTVAAIIAMQALAIVGLGAATWFLASETRELQEAVAALASDRR